jgi:pyruvate dehydrogenase E2 component (dihydrolipoamide acetyltransferase)
MEFRVPDLGEGIEQATVVRLLVGEGDSISIGQELVELETEKATIAVPATGAGKVEKLLAKPGDKVRVGSKLLAMSAVGDVSAKSKQEPTPLPSSEPIQTPVYDSRSQISPVALAKPQVANGALVPAGPSTRRLARELGIDLALVTGTAPSGRVTQDDVKSFVRNLSKLPARDGAKPQAALPDFSRYGPIEKKQFTALRGAIAKNLTLSWNAAPQVTQHDLADITDLEAGRKRFVEAAPKGSPKVTMTVLAVKACVAALKAYPQFNASYDAASGEHGELILKRYFHIGIAVDTERGLLVPVIRDADKKNVSELARELNEMAEKARGGKLTPDEMRGGTFTITNLGGIGGTAFSPIINYPEVAILGMSRSSWQPVVRADKIEPRLMLPISLTYDHRVIDGADGARFAVRVAAMLADPVRLVLES